MATTRKRTATFLRALAARLDPQPASTFSMGWITGPCGGNTAASGMSAGVEFRLTHAGWRSA